MEIAAHATATARGVTDVNATEHVAGRACGMVREVSLNKRKQEKQSPFVISQTMTFI